MLPLWGPFVTALPLHCSDLKSKDPPVGFSKIPGNRLGKSTSCDSGLSQLSAIKEEAWVAAMCCAFVVLSAFVAYSLSCIVLVQAYSAQLPLRVSEGPVVTLSLDEI